MRILEVRRNIACLPARISAMAASIPLMALLDLGAVAIKMIASASGIRASGNPSWNALSTHADDGGALRVRQTDYLALQ